MSCQPTTSIHSSVGTVTDEPKKSLPPKAELDAVDDIGAIDVPDAPDTPADIDERVDATAVTSHTGPEADSADSAGAASSDLVGKMANETVDEPTRSATKAEDSAVDAIPTSDSDEQRPRRDIYDVAGRARPQWIVPKTPVADPQPAPDEIQLAPPARGTLDPTEAPGTISVENPDVLADPNLSESTGVPDGESETQVFHSQPKFDDARSAIPAEAEYSHTEETAFFGASTADPTVNDIAAPDGQIGSAETQEAAPHSVPESGEELATAVYAPRGTLDLGLFLLRILVGVPLILRGLQTLFSFGGDPGIDALEIRFGDFTAGDILAIALPTAEVVGGGLLVLGLATPIGGAVAFIAAGFMALFELSLSDVGYWPYQMSQSAQSWAFLGLISLILIVTGPGRYSADLSRPWATRPRVSAWLWTTISIAGMVVLWLFVAGGNPF